MVECEAAVPSPGSGTDGGASTKEPLDNERDQRQEEPAHRRLKESQNNNRLVDKDRGGDCQQRDHNPLGPGDREIEEPKREDQDDTAAEQYQNRPVDDPQVRRVAWCETAEQIDVGPLGDYIGQGDPDPIPQLAGSHRGDALKPQTAPGRVVIFGSPPPNRADDMTCLWENHLPVAAPNPERLTEELGKGQGSGVDFGIRLD